MGVKKSSFANYGWKNSDFFYVFACFYVGIHSNLSILNS